MTATAPETGPLAEIACPHRTFRPRSPEMGCRLFPDLVYFEVTGDWASVCGRCRIGCSEAGTPWPPPDAAALPRRAIFAPNPAGNGWFAAERFRVYAMPSPLLSPAGPPDSPNRTSHRRSLSSILGALGAIVGRAGPLGRRLASAIGRARDGVVLAGRLAAALEHWAARGFPVVSAAEAGRRRSICGSCPYWDERGFSGLGRCRHRGCGCSGVKLYLASERCPDDPPRW